jgi:hypothetical protein
MQPAARKKAPLESRRRLSESILWRWQRSFFERRGVRAWSAGTVPHHITSNPFVADAYARVVFGFLRDAKVAGIDRAQPVHVVELGAGSGRFGYLFLKKLLRLCRESAVGDVAFRYVMTDFAEQNVEHLRGHPWLRPLFDAGILDVARFDAERDVRNGGKAEIALLHCGEVLAPGALKNPLVVIANYLFDSLPQDAFAVAEGRLYETLVTVSSPQDEPDLDDPAILGRAEVEYHDEPVDGPYYEDPAWDRLLDGYRRRLPATSFLFPTAALRCAETLLGLAGGRMLLLAGDRGYCRDEALVAGHGRPSLAMHGSFSMMVDFQLLGERCRQLGGEPLHPEHRAESLNVSAFLYGGHADTGGPGGFPETRHAFAEAVDKFGPDDFFTLKGSFEQVYRILTLEQLLAFLRWTGWDPKRFAECLPILKERLDGFLEAQKADLHDAVGRVWDAYLPIGEEQDLAFEIGTFLIELGLYAEALPYLDHSVRLYGLEPGTAYNRALCHHGLGQWDDALEWVNRALELAPDFDAARALRIQLGAGPGS